MPRPRCRARVRGLPAVSIFKPRGVPTSRLEIIELAVEEFEALKLADLQGLYHAEAAARMEVSRPTFGRILASARGKTAAALAHGKGIAIEGGHYRQKTSGGHGMKIAVATDAKNQISKHFGRSAVMSVYEIEDGKILGREDRPMPQRGKGAGHGHGHAKGQGHGQSHGHGCGTPGHGKGGGRGHGWLGELVSDCSLLVCGGIGAGARDQLGGLGLRVLLAEKGDSPEEAALRGAEKAGESAPTPGCPENH